MKRKKFVPEISEDEIALETKGFNDFFNGLSSEDQQKFLQSTKLQKERLELQKLEKALTLIKKVESIFRKEIKILKLSLEQAISH